MVFVVSAAAGAQAFELSRLFTGSVPPAAIKGLAVSAVPAVPAPTAEPVSAAAFPLNIKPEEARSYIESERPVVIDIRTADEYAAGHLEATTLQLDYYAPDFKEKLAALDKTAKYLIYCRSGRRSASALLTMKDLGFIDTHDIEGGINAWITAGLPVVK